ncbi:uncharacterized protein CXorf65 homolog [Amphiura filiformis]|uniref:uncharacterized protein CXorf65 homolog n=1 Tax=Amphiura filiformis TaxID=82378 RepID=UPI003B210642
MFITVKYGEKEEALFNPNCKTLLLLENIKLRCNCTDDVDVDLSDHEGNVKHLLEAPARYANEVLKGREAFVLVKVEKNDDSQKPNYVPLLNDSEAIDAAFLARLSTKDSSGSGSAKGRKKRGSKDGSKDHKSNRGSGKTTPTLGRKSKQR